jgi:hypothetical protein
MAVTSAAHDRWPASPVWCHGDAWPVAMPGAGLNTLRIQQGRGGLTHLNCPSDDPGTVHFHSATIRHTLCSCQGNTSASSAHRLTTDAARRPGVPRHPAINP